MHGANHHHLWIEFDRITREAPCILGDPLTDLQWGQAQSNSSTLRAKLVEFLGCRMCLGQVKLPVSMGGLGMRAAEDHGAAAHAVSLLSSQSLARELLYLPEEEGNQATLPPSLLQLLSSRQGEEATAESLQDISQKAISVKIDLHNVSIVSEHYTRAHVFQPTVTVLLNSSILNTNGS